RLPQERLKNKRALDNAARRAAEAQGLGTGKLVPQPLRSASEAVGPAAAARPARGTAGTERPEAKAVGPATAARPARGTAGTERPEAKQKKSAKSPVTGMTLKSPRSKANSVDRISFDGMSEPEQAGFGHVPSSRITARDISRAAAKDPGVMARMREALGDAAEAAQQGKVKTPGSRTPGKKVKLPGQDLSNAQTVGISATVKALEDIILHGRKE